LKHGNKHFITLTCNTDGARVFKSAKESALWPLQFFVNEISPQKCFKRENLLIAALAFGKTPDMCSLLRPFVEEINAINRKGGIPININNKIVMFLVIPHIWTLDSVAKCDVLRKVQYSGYCGCLYCHHAGSSVNGQVRYCRENNGSERSNENTRDAMKTAYLFGNLSEGTTAYRRSSHLI
jgi:hypothetical protein